MNGDCAISRYIVTRVRVYIVRRYIGSRYSDLLRRTVLCQLVQLTQCYNILKYGFNSPVLIIGEFNQAVAAQGIGGHIYIFLGVFGCPNLTSSSSSLITKNADFDSIHTSENPCIPSVFIKSHHVISHRISTSAPPANPQTIATQHFLRTQIKI